MWLNSQKQSQLGSCILRGFFLTQAPTEFTVLTVLISKVSSPAKAQDFKKKKKLWAWMKELEALERMLKEHIAKLSATSEEHL